MGLPAGSAPGGRAAGRHVAKRQDKDWPDPYLTSQHYPAAGEMCGALPRPHRAREHGSLTLAEVCRGDRADVLRRRAEAGEPSERPGDVGAYEALLHGARPLDALNRLEKTAG